METVIIIFGAIAISLIIMVSILLINGWRKPKDTVPTAHEEYIFIKSLLKDCKTLEGLLVISKIIDEFTVTYYKPEDTHLNIHLKVMWLEKAYEIDTSLHT